jgi:hypothetical protein
MSQRFRSQFGRPSIQVPDSCPTCAITRRLGRIHVGTADHDVTTMVREGIAEARARGSEGWTAKAEQDAIRFALWQHAENRAEYIHVMSGSVR